MTIESIILTFLLLTNAIGTLTSAKSLGKVISLTKENFTKAISENDYLLVNFYAPWCGHCKVLAPKFAKASKEMATSNPPVKFAQIDATENDELAYEQQVRSYPTLRFYRKSVQVPYTGENEAEDIIEWLNKELEPRVRELKSDEEIDQFIDDHPIAIIGLFNNRNSEFHCTFNMVAAEMKEYDFGIVTNDKLIGIFNLSGDNVVLYNSHDDGKVVYSGGNNRETLKRFIQLYSLPLIVEFEHSTASKILRGPAKAFLLFFLSDEDDQYIEPLRDVARSYRDHVLFVTVTYDNIDKRRVFEYFGITEKQTPTILLITIDENDELIKYKPNCQDLSVKSVDDFIQQYIEGCLDRYYLSQTLPDDWDANPVKILVATNFHNVAFDNTKTVLVEFYAPWCGLCKQLEPILNQLAKMYDNYDDVVIAKINGVSNEVDNLKVTAFPTIKLFLKDTNQMISYNGARTLDGLKEFLKQHGIVTCEKDEL